MTGINAKSWWRPRPASMIAACLIIAGLILSNTSWWFFILVGLGIFGPGLLREFGALRDKDEFQSRSTHRAGYHAFLAAGIIAAIFVAYNRSGERNLKEPEELATLFLVVLWFTWLLSSLLSFVGAKRAAVRILIGYGAFWLLFSAASHITEPAALLMEGLMVTGPFFVLAFLSRRWPRLSGFLLIAATAFFLYRFQWYEIGRSGLVNQCVVMILFLGPLLASGIALLTVRPALEQATER
ncbi:MAG: hypothetical protein HY770_04050 [Chitinivibrionia bacterium]|nr:hypothetical protein [Chitinivibrionia bacterium]